MPVLLSDGTFFGTLCAVDPEPQTLTPQQADMLVVLARLLATQIERERVELRAVALQEITAALAGARTVDDVAGVILSRGLDALDARFGAVFVLDDEAKEFRTVQLVGYPAELRDAWQTFPADAPVPIADAVRRGELLVHESEEEFVSAYPHLEGARSSGGAVASIPLLAHGEAMGAIGVGFGGPRSLGDQERAFMLTLAGFCAQAMERARLFDSEREARADAQEALRLRDGFLSAVGHDLGTPLTAIKGMAQLMQRRLRRTGTPPDMAALGELSARIVQSSDRMASLLGELMDLTRLRSGQTLELHRVPTDLVALSRRVVEEHRQAVRRSEIQVEAAEPELFCSCDAGRLERVVSNLVGNAAKYSPPDRCRITITVAPDEDGHAVLSVKDEGIGIPAGELGRVLDLYYRATNVPSESQGSGIGLAGSRQIIDQHGGTLTIESAEGVGTTVTVRLPCG